MTSGKIQIATSSHMELIDITEKVSKVLQAGPNASGLFFLYNPHTTAGLTINEGADPAVRDDIIKGLSHIVPELKYKHMEGNSPSHIMALLTGNSLTIEIRNSQLVLGTWQRVFFCEYDGPRNRTINWKLIEA